MIPLPAPVRVLMVLGSLAGGGAERIAVDLVAHCDPRKIDFRVGLLRREGAFLDRVARERLLGPAGRERGVLSAARAPFDVAELIRESAADVVMSFGIGPNLATGAALALRRRPRPYWICREDCNPWSEIDNQAGGPLIQAILSSAVRLAWRAADCVLAVSDDLTVALSKSVPRVRSLHNPIDVDAIAAMAAEPLAEAPPRPFVVAAGRLVRQKGFDLLLEAFAASRLAKDLDLVILGDGPQRSQLSRRADELGIALRLPGFQANPWSWFARARLFVLPSRWEGFSNVVAEAMACGAPVLVSDCDFGPREQVVHGVSGWVARPADLADALDILLADPALLARLAAAGRERSREFAAQKIARTFEELVACLPVRRPDFEPAGHSVGGTVTALAPGAAGTGAG